ncbi:hypothetical protein A9Q84_09335 [Halobacteriovorax marinus]|uniref:Periplasmic binding protein domain-containing protein n=1 Tax=Halobacteriovorax marinus TaxID=97084 RepID=A0A1Y5FAM7_9BACT|nr:hypothetical protein A9Q84_09335 [Halobacteriovorax marinus]
MKKISIYLCLLISLNSHSDEFWHINEYFKHHPKQEQLLNDFSKVVTNLPIQVKAKQRRPIKISVIYPGKQISDYWKRSLSSFKARLDLLNIKYQIEEFFTKPGVEIRKQAKHILQSLKGNPDYLIFTLDAKKHQKIITQILSKGKTKVILQNITTPLKLWKNHPPFLYVGFDHQLGSKLLLDRILQIHPNGGKFAMLYLTDGYVSKMRGDSFIGNLKQHKKWKLVGRYYTDNDENKIKKALEDLTTNEKDIQLVFSCSTDIAITSAKFSKKNKLDFTINGWGGGSAELESLSLKKNGIDLTVMRINDDNGVAMAEAIKYELEDRSSLIPRVFSGEMVIIDKSTTKEEIEKLKKRSFRYSR